jgi:hypothetical protein
VGSDGTRHYRTDLGCRPSPLVARAGAPTDTVFYFSGSASEGINAFEFSRMSANLTLRPELFFAADHLNRSLSAARGLQISTAFSPASALVNQLPSGDASASVAAWISCAPFFSTNCESVSSVKAHAAVARWGVPGSATSPALWQKFFGILVATAAQPVRNSSAGTQISWPFLFPVCDGTWVHAALVHNASDNALTAFVNGNVFGATTATFSIPATRTALALGFNGDNSSCAGEPFPGSYSDVRVFDRALSAAEVKLLSQAQIAPAATAVGSASPAPR